MSNKTMITDRIHVEVEFHQVDMMGVVHNAEYLRWFERGRLALLEPAFSVGWAMEHGLAIPVVQHRVEYPSSAAFGDRLVVTSRHELQSRWSGRLVFEHSISNAKTKLEVCCGTTEVTVIDLEHKRPLKEIPEAAWQRYLSLGASK